MDFRIDRRTALKAGAALAAAYAVGARAQARPTLRFASVFSDKDIRADMVRMLAKDIGGDYNVDMFLNASLFKQGTELVALQRVPAHDETPPLHRLARGGPSGT